jgi:hypothetical protein
VKLKGRKTQTRRHWRDAKMKGRFVQRERQKGLTEAFELAKTPKNLLLKMVMSRLEGGSINSDPSS